MFSPMGSVSFLLVTFPFFPFCLWPLFFSSQILLFVFSLSLPFSLTLFVPFVGSFSDPPPPGGGGGSVLFPPLVFCSATTLVWVPGTPLLDWLVPCPPAAFPFRVLSLTWALSLWVLSLSWVLSLWVLSLWVLLFFWAWLLCSFPSLFVG